MYSEYMSKAPKRPRDPNELAHNIMRIATGEAENDRPEEKAPKDLWDPEGT